MLKATCLSEPAFGEKRVVDNRVLTSFGLVSRCQMQHALRAYLGDKLYYWVSIKLGVVGRWLW